MELNQIGYFQFDNLIQSRVPFLLVNLGADFTDWYKGPWAMHLESANMECSITDAVELVQAKGLPSHFALVVIDVEGKQAADIALALEKVGFSNVYFVKNGALGLLAERRSGI